MLRPALALALVLLQSTAAAPRFDSGRAFDHLRRLVAFGPRPAGSPAIEQSRQYIRSQLQALGLSATEQAWDETTPVGRLHMVNLAVTLPGTSTDRLIIAGHYDTKRFREFRFVGANDGGSSAAFLLELARVLQGGQHALTIDLLFLDGEEATINWEGTDRVYGSRHYVQEARRTGRLSSLKAFLLVDMIADRDLEFRRDLNSTPWLTQLIWDAARARDLGRYFVDDPTEIEDDHLPFVEAGIPAVDIIDLDYPAWHTAGDTLDAVSARSLQIVGDTLLAALPRIEERLTQR